MAIPSFDFKEIVIIPQWSIYLVIFLLLKVLVLAIYVFWIRYNGEIKLVVADDEIS
jgi:hypothetical protein